MQKTNIEVLLANYQNPLHQLHIPQLLDSYARDPMGGGQALDEKVKQQLVSELAKLPHAFSILAYVDGKAAGLANCFMGFSTFAAKPLVNIHDLIVHPQYRGLGLSQQLLQNVEGIALARGCCKITLEVLSNNPPAQGAYRKFGFAGYSLTPEAGTAQFWQKHLPC